MIEYSEDDFYETFGPLYGPDGSTFWTSVPQGTPIIQVWSVLGGNDGDYAMPGDKWVNRVAYMITEVPWNNEDIIVFLETHEDDEPFYEHVDDED